MILYTCPIGVSGPSLHPCARAGKALDAAGLTYETRAVNGGSLMVWTWPTRARDRQAIEDLSGQRSVPILVCDDQTVIVGSAEIANWAKANAASTG